MKTLSLLAGGLSLFLAASPGRADVWDEGGDPDNTCGGTPDNDLLHGAEQVHDLGALPGPAVDQDFYIFAAQSFASYEAVVDGLTGDLNNGGNPDFVFDRLSSGCGSVQTAEPTGAGFSKSLRFEAPSSFVGALHEHVVHTHRHQVDADPVVAPERERELQLGADAVGAGDEDRLLVLLRDRAQRAEAAQPRQHLRSHGALGERLDRFDERITGVDVDARVTVRKGFRHGR